MFHPAQLLPVLLLTGCLVLKLKPRTLAGDEPSAEVRANVEQHVRTLAAAPRNWHHQPEYRAARAYITTAWTRWGYTVEEVETNLVATLPGGPETVLLGAHFDSCDKAPGADDNASGVAAMLEVSRLLAGQRFRRTVRFVAFADEEPPWFQGPAMGSLLYAQHSTDLLDTVIVLDGVGYYADKQSWPLGLGIVLPSEGNFLLVVSRMRSADQVRRVTAALRAHSLVPIAGATAPPFVTGVDWSDHWSFWQEGHEAVLITDLPPYRNPHYHEVSDQPDTVDFDRLGGFAQGLAAAIKAIADRS